jgi:hypothetical protein
MLWPSSSLKKINPGHLANTVAIFLFSVWYIKKIDKGLRANKSNYTATCALVALKNA